MLLVVVCLLKAHSDFAYSNCFTNPIDNGSCGTLDSIGLCMAVYGCVWLRMAAVYGCVWLCMAVYGCVWLCMAAELKGTLIVCGTRIIMYIHNVTVRSQIQTVHKYRQSAVPTLAGHGQFMCRKILVIPAHACLASQSLGCTAAQRLSLVLITSIRSAAHPT